MIPLSLPCCDDRDDGADDGSRPCRHGYGALPGCPALIDAVPPGLFLLLQGRSHTNHRGVSGGQVRRAAGRPEVGLVHDLLQQDFDTRQALRHAFGRTVDGPQVFGMLTQLLDDSAIRHTLFVASLLCHLGASHPKSTRRSAKNLAMDTPAGVVGGVLRYVLSNSTTMSHHFRSLSLMASDAASRARCSACRAS